MRLDVASFGLEIYRHLTQESISSEHMKASSEISASFEAQPPTKKAKNGNQIIRSSLALSEGLFSSRRKEILRLGMRV